MGAGWLGDVTEQWQGPTDHPMVVALQIVLGEMHGQEEQADQPEIHRRHRTSLHWCDLKVALLFIAAPAEEGEYPGH